MAGLKIHLCEERRTPLHEMSLHARLSVITIVPTTERYTSISEQGLTVENLAQNRAL
jgi:hypothetical protein